MSYTPDGWPVGSTDAEINAAGRLTEVLQRKGFVTFDGHDIIEAFGGEAPLSVYGVHTGLVSAGFKPFWAPTGITPVADVAEVSSELWMRAWVEPLTLTGVSCGGLGRFDDADDPDEVNAVRVQRENVQPFTCYMRCVRRVVRHRPDVCAAILAAWRVGATTTDIHNMLFTGAV